MTAKEYVKETGKSRILSFFLTLLLGPVGLLYTSIVGGIIMIILVIVSATTYIGPIILWILSIALGDYFAYKYNQRLLAQSNFMKDLAGKSDNVTSNQENLDTQTLIQEDDDNFKISFHIKDKNSWKNIKTKLWTFYQKYHINNIISDNEKSWFIKGEKGVEGYVRATLTDNIITIESYKLLKPDNFIIEKETKQNYKEKLIQTNNSTDKLIDLGKLFDKELITKEEFEAEKKKILEN